MTEFSKQDTKFVFNETWMFMFSECIGVFSFVFTNEIEQLLCSYYVPSIVVKLCYNVVFEL